MGSSSAMTVMLQLLYHGGLKFNSSATFVSNQLVCLLPAGDFNLVMFNSVAIFVSEIKLLAPIAFSYNTDQE